MTTYHPIGQKVKFCFIFTLYTCIRSFLCNLCDDSVFIGANYMVQNSCLKNNVLSHNGEELSPCLAGNQT